MSRLKTIILFVFVMVSFESRGVALQIGTTFFLFCFLDKVEREEHVFLYTIFFSTDFCIQF